MFLPVFCLLAWIFENMQSSHSCSRTLTLTSPPLPCDDVDVDCNPYGGNDHDQREKPKMTPAITSKKLTWLHPEDASRTAGLESQLLLLFANGCCVVVRWNVKWKRGLGQWCFGYSCSLQDCQHQCWCWRNSYRTWQGRRCAKADTGAHGSYIGALKRISRRGMKRAVSNYSIVCHHNS